MLTLVIDGLQQRFRELLDVPVGVDVAGRLNRLMAKELLNRLQVSVGTPCPALSILIQPRCGSVG